MSNLVVDKSLATFPSGVTYGAQEYANALVARLTLSISSGSVIFGQLGGTEPVSPLSGNGAYPGLWISGHVIYDWNSSNSKYLPIPVVAAQLISGTIFSTEIACGAFTASTIVTTPDKSGTMALLSDLTTFVGTQTPSGASITLDWSLKKPAYVLLGANTVIVNTGGYDGQIQDLWVENNATAYTLTINGVIWPAATAPTVTTASAGQRRISHIRLYQVGSNVFGESVLNYQIATGTDATPPTPSTFTGYSTAITIAMSELIQGGSLSVGGFTVKKNGTTQTVNTAVASGNIITLTLASAFSSGNTLTVQYTGSSIMDLSGNLAASFGPTAVTITTSSGGGGGGGSGGGRNIPYQL